jgi:hypothetical protein
MSGIRGVEGCVVYGTWSLLLLAWTQSSQHWRRHTPPRAHQVRMRMQVLMLRTCTHCKSRTVDLRKMQSANTATHSSLACIACMQHSSLAWMLGTLACYYVLQSKAAVSRSSTVVSINESLPSISSGVKPFRMLLAGSELVAVSCIAPGTANNDRRHEQAAVLCMQHSSSNCSTCSKCGMLQISFHVRQSVLRAKNKRQT